MDPDADAELVALWPAARLLAAAHAVSPLVCLRALEMATGDEVAAAAWLATDKKHWVTPTPTGIYRCQLPGGGGTVTVTLSGGAVTSVVVSIVDDVPGTPKSTARLTGTYDPDARTLALTCSAFTAKVVLAEDLASAVLTRTPAVPASPTTVTDAPAAAPSPEAPITL